MPGESLLFVLRERLADAGGRSASRGSAALQRARGRVVGVAPVLAASAVGRRIVIVEGIAPPRHRRSRRSSTLARCSAVSHTRSVMATHSLLERVAEPTELEIREELSGNICRCTGYGRIIDAVQRVAVARRGGGA